jgi:hypothetical protein
MVRRFHVYKNMVASNIQQYIAHIHTSTHGKLHSAACQVMPPVSLGAYNDSGVVNFSGHWKK